MNGTGQSSGRTRRSTKQPDIYEVYRKAANVKPLKSPHPAAYDHVDSENPTPIFSLPPELLSRIFEYLAEDRHDISSSRLVDKSFKAASSPFLITEVVFAKRLSEIAKLQEVACHPYFSRHVTHIVYDLSYWKFNEFEMNDPTEMMEYIAACEEAEDFDIRTFLDEEWAHRVQEESEFYRSLSENGGEPSTNAAEAFLYDHQSAPTMLTKGMLQRQRSALDDIDEAGGEAFRMGCYQSFPQYKRNAHFHERIASNGEYLSILVPILKKLPKLRGITFTDYRGLARRGETYQHLCSRIFGNMLEPERWNWQLDHGSCTTEAIVALKAIAHTTGGLHSISFGPHFYEMASTSIEPLLNYKEPHYLSIEDLTFTQPTPMREMLQGARSIRLPLLFTEATFSPTEPEILLNALPATLQHLALSAKGPVEGFSMLLQASAQVQRPFKQLISPLRFPRLTTLELEGWVIPLPSLRDFLLAHAGTLRTLHLINTVIVCAIDEQDPNLDRFGDLIASKLHLTGVEITGLQMAKPHDIPDIPAEDDTWLMPFQHEDDEEWNGDLEVIENGGGDKRREARFLGGRANNVRRRRPVLADGHKGDDLGHVPAYW